MLARLIDAGVLGVDLGVEVVDRGDGLPHLRFCLCERGLVVARIDPHQNGAGIRKLVVGHRNLDHDFVECRSHLHLPRIDERVVGGFIA